MWSGGMGRAARWRPDAPPDAPKTRDGPEPRRRAVPYLGDRIRCGVPGRAFAHLPASSGASSLSQVAMSRAPESFLPLTKKVGVAFTPSSALA